MFVSCMTLFKDFFVREHGNVVKHPAKWATDEETEKRKDEPRIFAKYDQDPDSLKNAAVVSYGKTAVVKLTGPNMHGKAEEVVDEYKNILRSELEKHIDQIVAAICNVKKLQAVASEESMIEFVTEGDNFGEKDGIFTLALPMIIDEIRKLPRDDLKTRVIMYKSAPRSKAAHHNPAFLEWESALGTDYSAENLYMAYCGHDDDEKTKTWKTALTYDSADVVVNIGSLTSLGVRKDGSKSIGMVETEEMVKKSTRTEILGEHKAIRLIYK